MRRISRNSAFTLIELMVVVAIIGVLAAIAIPAFMKNAKKAKTTEATINVKKVLDGAVTYYHEEANKAGSAIPIAHQFPDTPTVNPIAPALGVCCAGPSGKCAADSTVWSDPSWQALKFSMDDPHYYSYGYTHRNPGAAAVTAGILSDGSTPTEFFFADALGDLDCNGTYSTFEMMGAVSADGSITTGGGLYKNLELE